MALLCTSQPGAVQSRNLVAVNNAAPGLSEPLGASGASQSAGDKTFPGADSSGKLVAMLGSGKQLGQCPLKHTDVSCDISGYIARVTVKQTFHNPFKDKIEAVYTFPLSDNGAVDEMLMKVGERTIHGTIKKREEAKQIYDQARANGQVASLLDQERTNIFTQSVANIEPGKEIEITIKYVETLPFEKGKYSFAFPTVVGPRFNPGNPVGKSGTGRAPDTDEVPDASRITPPVPPAGQRAGHDLSINVHLNAGMAISDLSSQLHQVNISNNGANQATVSLTDKETIPNKDFVLSWNVAQDKLKSGYLTYRDPQSKEGFFTLMLVPPKSVKAENVAPKEMIFVIDCSGSQSGPPLQKCKETMNYILDHMNANDTFQIIAFSNNTMSFAEHPQKVSEEMKDRAHKFISSLQANGGTWMAPAVEQACNIPADSHRLRIVTFMTDGFVGNDFEILGMVKKLRGLSRWFPFGTGNSVNRMLIDSIAKEGGGEPDYVLLNSSAEEAGKKFYDRIASPVLTDIKVAFDGVQVKDVYPKEVSDVWAQRPLYFKGKYTVGGAGTVTLTGYSGGKPYEQKLAVNFPENNTANPGIASLWARAKVDRLMAEDYMGAQRGAVNKELKEEIVETALAHHIMTQYTSFVAVDEKTVTKNGKLVTVPVPVEVPDGVSREKTIGSEGNFMGAPMPMQAAGMPMAGKAMMRGRAAMPARFQSYGGAGYTPGGAGGGAGGGNGAPSTWYKAKRQIQVADGSAYSMAPGPSLSLSSPQPSSLASGMANITANKPLVKDYRSAVDKLSAPSETKPSETFTKELSKSANAKAEAEGSKGLAHSDRDDKSATLSEEQVNKLSASVRLLLKNPSANVDGLKRSGDRIQVIIKVNNATREQIAALKKLGLEIVKDKVSGEKTLNEIKGLIKISKLSDLVKLDFVLSVLLDSDRK